MEENLLINKNYQMLGYLADRGQITNMIEVCSGLWDELLDAPYERDWFRFLRIELRRLRSALALLGPLLPEEGSIWLEQLKLRSNQLGNVREYDVALQSCEKYEIYVSEAVRNNVAGAKELLKELPGLKAIVLAQREERSNAFNASVTPGCIAQEMNLCMELLKETVELSIEDEAKANAFLQSSLQIWGLKLCNKLQNLEKLKTMNQLHKLRIKVKRFRYAYEVYMNKAADEEVLASLKELQDILGSLHDSDRNIEIIDELTANAAMDEELAQEIACFKAWRKLKMEQRLAQLSAVQQRVLNSMKQTIVGVELL